MRADKDLTAGPLPGWRERLGWALLHDGVAHPLMALTLYSRWATRFHVWTGQRAWQPLHKLPPML